MNHYMNRRFGTTYSTKYASQLGLDPKLAYLRILDEFNFKIIRLCAYWDLIEPKKGEFNFDFLDYQIEEASKRGIEIILAVGRKVPRWPEYHEPKWALELDYEDFENFLKDFIATVIKRYEKFEYIKLIQIENEAFLKFNFGITNIKISKQTTISEIESAKAITNKTIATTDALKWGNPKKLLELVDVVGINIYTKSFKKRIFNKNLYLKMNYSDKLIQNKIKGYQNRMFIAELQTEPWGSNFVNKLSRDEVQETASIESIEKNIEFAYKTEIRDILFWGAEWWIYIEKGYPEIMKLIKDFTFYRRSF